MTLKTVGGPGVGGLHPAPTIVKAKASEALTLGDICMFDFAATAATTIVPGDAASPFYLVRDPDAAGTSLQTLNGYIFGVALEDIAAAATGQVMVRGICTMNVDSATAAGSCIVPATNGQGDVATGGTNLKIIAISLEADASNLAKVWLNGVEGFGTDVGANVST